jgi:hypothetical protein
VSVCTTALMPQAISILIWDQADPWTVRRVAEAIEEYQSVILPCSSAAAILFTLRQKTVDCGHPHPPKTASKHISAAL